MRDREGFPLASIDVATMEVRAVVNGIDGISECHHAATEKAKGYIVSVMRAEALAAAPLNLLLDDGNLLASCGHAIASPAGSRR
jgi:hypothetical protein